MTCQRCGQTSYENGGVPVCCQCGKKQTIEQFPPEIATVLDISWAARESAHELDAEGRFVRGVYEGMTMAEVMADREAFRRCMPD